jgi:hypothetical protein
MQARTLSEDVNLNPIKLNRKRQQVGFPIKKHLNHPQKLAILIVDIIPLCLGAVGKTVGNVVYDFVSLAILGCSMAVVSLGMDLAIEQLENCKFE